MFPPQDALPLLPRPSVQQYEKRAKDLLKAARSPDPAALRAWASSWISSLAQLSNLEISPQLPVRLDHWINQLEEFAREELADPVWGRTHSSVPPTEGRRSDVPTLAAAQFVIARAHGFESWTKLSKHLAARANSPISTFEQAADAIVTGDLAHLKKLLRAHPALIRARSTRQHQATLLHYIGANGVEGYRQKTPPNAVAIAELLLASGADVNATALLYGGDADTLGLVATSIHPQQAGVQLELLDLLLRHGASLHPMVVNACLANGRRQSAEFLALRGAHLDLETAAGVGRLDLVKTFLDEKGNLLTAATQIQMERGFLWASEYGRNEIVEFLLQRGVDVATQAHTGQTALHWAVIGAQLSTIHLLLRHNAPLEDKNTYGGTPLGQALWSMAQGDPHLDYIPVIEALLKAGAKIEDGARQWLSKQKTLPPNQKQRLVALLK
jgi:ankyrin repeat protein